MKFDPNKSVKRLSNNIQHDIVQLRTPSARRRRKSHIGNNEKMTPTTVQSSENLWPPLQKCLICRNSECIDNKCCEFLQSSPPNLSHHKTQTMKKKNQSSSTSPFFCPFEMSSQIIHNQKQQQHQHNHHRGSRSSHFHQCHQQQQQQQQQRYCNSTNSRLDVQESTTKSILNPVTSSSSPSQIPKDSEKFLIREDAKMADIRWMLPVAYRKGDFMLSNCSKKFKSWRTFTSKIPSLFVWFAISFFLVNFSINLIVSGAYAKDIKPRLRGAGKVCPSADIRNNPLEFRNLSDCSVIEGFLIISLLDKYSEEDYDMSFPDLTEITDYMVVYRVNGLKTLGKLFPNLSVIRGNVLFEGYALVIYENTHLEEIALKSLLNIKRGAVRIEKNPVLCFVETIDWSEIAINTSTENHFFRSNKVVNECPSCPGGNSKSDRSDGSHHIEEGKSCAEYTGGRRYCWNRQHCQKICPTHCKNSCNDRGECCHTSCLGGCANNDVNSCFVCKHLVYGNECTDVCPENSYKYLERSCVTVQECFSKSPPLNTADSRSEYPFIPFQGKCSNRCPTGYEKYRNETCRRCDGKCVKTCPAASIDSISDARRLRGCNVITGSLIISIRQGGPHIMEDLEVALSSIEEIEGNLKVTRSFSLLSLSFFKGLKVIRGKELDSNKYALYVLDNQNLQSIWGDNQTVLIERGRIFFHFNPKLCYYKIENLRSMMIDNATLDKSEVATDSNGDRGSCNITTLGVVINNVGPRAAVIRVQPMKFEDDRGFIGYQYYYIEAPFKNVSIFDSRHGCGGNDGWNVDDDNSKELTHIFTHLKPYTQYAFYVKTYTISTETNNGQSPIMYFRTQPDKPEPVRNLRSITNSSSEVIVKWSPPRVANGNLTMYVIKANLTLDDPKLLEQRNYCEEPIRESFEVPTIIKPDGKETSLPEKDAKDCNCDDPHSRGKSSPKIEEDEIVNIIDFEDAIQNFIYVKKETEKKSVRRKRDLDNITMTTTDISTGANDKIFPKEKEQPVKNVSSEIDPIEITKSVKKGNYYIYIYKIVNTSVQELVLKNLKHYSTYTISVKACREGVGDRCSNEAITYPRTGRLGGADNVQNLVVEVISTNSSRSHVRLKWDPPKEPNGLIVSYSIRYSRADIEHAKGIDQCITQRGYENLTNGFFVLKNLETGNYSVQIMPTSLAGDGNYTAAVYFFIPEKSISLQVILIICFTTLFVVLLFAVLFWYIRKKYVATVPDLKLFTSVNPEYVSMHYTPDEWEIPRDKIIQLRELGQGSFGMVYEGIVKNLNKSEEDTPCAIKTVNESATDRERINFLNEASVMKEFDTHHVVRLLGVCSRGQPTLVVMELMKFGDLKAYLRSHRPDADSVKAGEPPPQPPTLKRILQMAIEIGDGMAYLSAKKFVHRDLAARNCMVACDLTVKIGDFGMTRDIYETDYYRKGTKGLLPVRWMAPESLKDGVFSSASDVFSYGVVLWEMATLASQPYQGLSNDQVLRYVIDGGVMERPENCPDKLYNLMRKCWQHRPTSRPSFIEIIQTLLDDADSKFREVSFYHSQEGQDLIAQMQPPTDIDDVTTPLRVGDDDFKMEIEDNYLNNSKHSRRSALAATEGQPHSPYSFGSAILTSSTPGAVSSLKRSSPTSLSSSLNQQQKKQQQFPVQSSSSSKYHPKDGATSTTTIKAAAATPAATPATATTGTVQNFLNSLSAAPRSRRMEFLRNAFLGNGNNSNSNNNSRQNSGGNGGGNLYGQTGTAGSAATGNISTIADSNEYNDGKNGNSRKSSKDYQILNESGVSTDDAGRDMKSSRRSSSNYEQLSLPSLFSLDKRTQPKQQQKQCNELDSKVTNSRRNSTKLSHSTSDSNSSNSCKDAEKMSTTASPYQLQQQQHNKYPKESGTPNRTSLQQPNGYIIASPQTDYSFSQDYQEAVPEEQMLLTKFQK